MKTLISAALSLISLLVLFYLLYAALALILYVAEASKSNRWFPRLIRRLVPFVYKRVASRRSKFDPATLARQDQSILRSLRRMAPLLLTIGATFMVLLLICLAWIIND